VSIAALPPLIRRALDEAAQGERILWAGQPRPARLWPYFGIWLFAIPWTVFSLFWEGMALMPWYATWTFGIVMPIFGIPFVMIGFAMMASPFWIMAKAKLTVHALTEKRLLTVTTGRMKKTDAVDIKKTGSVTTQIAADGSGSFKVTTGSHIDSDGDRITDRFDVVGVDDAAGLAREFRKLRDN
jgi:hypothetical protein